MHKKITVYHQCKICIIWLNILWQTHPELDTCYERRHPACEHDTADSRLPDNKEFATKKGWIVEKWLLSFLQDSENGNYGKPFDLLRITESTGFVKRRLRCSDRRRSKWTDSNIKLINNLNCSQDGKQVTNS